MLFLSYTTPRTDSNNRKSFSPKKLHNFLHPAVLQVCLKICIVLLWQTLMPLSQLSYLTRHVPSTSFYFIKNPKNSLGCVISLFDFSFKYMKFRPIMQQHPAKNCNLLISFTAELVKVRVGNGKMYI